jgi:phosphohistidine phosphatase
MRLYLVRHGESVAPEIDPNQPLSEKGIKETEAVARLLKQASLEIDEIMHSTKMRAKQTAEILGKALAFELTLIQREGLKPMDPVEPIVSELGTLDRNVMLVGHLPFLEKLLTLLLMGKEGPSPVNLCGSCVICLETNHGQLWQIAWAVSPELCYPNLVQKHA